MTAKARALLFLSLLLSATTATAGTRVHVSPDGNDTAVGTREAPFRTIERGLAATRSADGPCRLVLLAGIHELERPLFLDQRDAGLRVEGRGTVRLVGGRIVQELTREGGVLVADLRAAGISDYGEPRSLGMKVRGPAAMEVFVDGRRQELARYPNHGWLTITSVPGGRHGKTLTVDLPPERLARWGKEVEPWVYGYWFHGWADSFLPVKGIDAAKRTITLGEAHHYGMKAERRFYARNLLCELDAPGEYWIDRERGRLHFLPHGGKPGEVIVSMLEMPILEITGTRDIVIEGLWIEAGRAGGVRIRDCEDVRIAGCEIRNVGGTGVEISGGRRCRVSGCEIRDTGAGGVRLSGGDRKTLSPSRHVAEGNHIHRTSRIRRTYTPAVSVGGVGNIVRRNLLHDAPHQAIQFGGNDHVIEKNEIHHVVLETDDAGAIYTCARDFTQRGTVIRHNRLHHCGPHHAPRVPDAFRTEPGVVYEPKHIHGTSLIYLDDLTGGTLVEGNVLEDAYRAVLIGGGRENTIRGNLVLGGNIGIWIDARGLGWAKGRASKGGDWGLYRKFEQVGGDREPLVSRYPGLATVLENHPAAPVDTVAVGNVVLGAKQGKKTDGRSDLFVRFERNHFGEATDAAPEAAVDEKSRRKTGFEPIPFGDIGPGRPPNIVLIMADDLGYETIGANGGTSWKTPCLDAVAAEGIRFTHAYATPLCTPSRVQIMTGKYNFRNYIGFGLLDPAERTFAHLLRDAGYRTAITGKWQLYGNAHQRKLAGRGGSRPEQAGFDEHLLWQVDDFGPRFSNPRLTRDGAPARDYP
ncbi:MAG: sulfatase-like hydrolase/transferase, partial [Planctomycetota bacterium]